MNGRTHAANAVQCLGGPWETGRTKSLLQGLHSLPKTDIPVTQYGRRKAL